MAAHESLFRLFSFRSLGSTMDEARALAREGFSGAAIVRADTQTSGRGRTRGRRWIDSPGRALLMTLLMPADFDEGKALPLRVGLGVARAMEQGRVSGLGPAAEGSGAEFLLKWPNDVVVRFQSPMGPARKGTGEAFSPTAPRGPAEYGKLCGILCESAGGRILIGIGVNLYRMPRPQASSGIQPAGLEEVWGILFPPFDALDDAARFVALRVAEALADPQWHSEYERRLWGRGSSVQFLAGHPESPEPVQGTCVGIDGEGRLVLDVGGERKAFASGEIASLRLV